MSRQQKSSEPVQRLSRSTSRLTRLGFHFLFVGSFALLGGALRGFNLLLVLAGLLIGILVMHWRWSRRTLEPISVRRRLPGEAFAGTAFRVRYRLTNNSSLMPAWMVRVEDQIDSIESVARKTFAKKSVSQTTAVSGAGIIRSGQTVLPSFDCLILKRGAYRFGPLSLTTVFPFALFFAKKQVYYNETLFVFPKLLSLKPSWRRYLITRTGGVSTTARRSGPSEGEFFGLREWQSGDSPKWIHWRTTARMNEPAVRQFEQQRRFDVCILLDAYDSSISSGGSKSETQAESDIEVAISLSATLIVQMLRSASNRIVLSVATQDVQTVMGGGNQLGKRKMLQTLAGSIPAEQPQVVEAISKAEQLVGQFQDIIIVSPRSLEEACRANSKLSERISPWVRRGCLKWIDVSDTSASGWFSRTSTSSGWGQQPVSGDQIKEKLDNDIDAPGETVLSTSEAAGN